MMDALAEFFSYGFVLRALAVGALVSVCAAPLGVSLVLKRYAMIGSGLAHVGFGALAVAVATHQSPLTVAMPVTLLAAFLLLRVSAATGIKGDAALALISSSSLAAGVIVVALNTGMNTDVCNYLFGSILVMTRADVWLSAALAVTVLAAYVLCYNQLFAVTFDEDFARAAGTRAGRYNTLLALLKALVVVVGMRLVGALLVSSLIIFPALSALRVWRSFKGVVVAAAALSVTAFALGMALSLVCALPAGASIVMVNLAVFIVAAGAGRLRRGV